MNRFVEFWQEIPEDISFPLAFSIGALVIATLFPIILMSIAAIETAIKSQKQRKQDVAFYNTPYLCENTACHTSFFRMHHVFDAYARREMLIPGDNNIDEEKYSRHLSPEIVHEMELVRCPSCQGHDIIRAKSYTWMNTDDQLVPLSAKALKKRRRCLQTEHSEKETKSALQSIKKNIDEIEEISSFQHRHRLTSPIDKALHEHTLRILEQLKLIQNETQSQTIKQQTNTLINRLNQTGAKQFADVTHTPPKQQAKPVDNEEISDALKYVFHHAKRHVDRLFDTTGKKSIPNIVKTAVHEYNQTKNIAEAIVHQVINDNGNVLETYTKKGGTTT